MNARPRARIKVSPSDGRVHIMLTPHGCEGQGVALIPEDARRIAEAMIAAADRAEADAEDAESSSGCSFGCDDGCGYCQG